MGLDLNWVNVLGSLAVRRSLRLLHVVTLAGILEAPKYFNIREIMYVIGNMKEIRFQTGEAWPSKMKDHQLDSKVGYPFIEEYSGSLS